MHAQSFKNEATPVPDQAVLIVGRTYRGKFEVFHPEMSTWKGQKKEAEAGPCQESTRCFYCQE